MAIVILNQNRMESIYAVVITVMDKQIPCVGNERTGQEGAAREQIDGGDAQILNACTRKVVWRVMNTRCCRRRAACFRACAVRSRIAII